MASASPPTPVYRETGTQRGVPIHSEILKSTPDSGLHPHGRGH